MRHQVWSLGFDDVVLGYDGYDQEALRLAEGGLYTEVHEQYTYNAERRSIYPQMMLNYLVRLRVRSVVCCLGLVRCAGRGLRDHCCVRALQKRYTVTIPSYLI